MDDPETDAEPAVLRKAEEEGQGAAARPGGMDQASAAASALAMDLDPDRQLHSFEIDSTQVDALSRLVRRLSHVRVSIQNC